MLRKRFDPKRVAGFVVSGRKAGEPSGIDRSERT